jgi:hypothetical protein
MKKAAKKKSKTYFQPLFKVNASKSEDIQKQSQLMVDNHLKLSQSENTNTITKDGLRKTHTKPKKDQFVIIHSFLEENDSLNDDIHKDTKPTFVNSNYKTNNNNNNKNNKMDIDIDITTVNSFMQIDNKNFNKDENIKNSNNFVNNNKSPSPNTINNFVFEHHHFNPMSENEANISSTSMTQSHSNGFSNLFKKSMKKTCSSSAASHHESNEQSQDQLTSSELLHKSYSDPHVKKTSSFRKLYNKTKGKRRISSENNDNNENNEKEENFIMNNNDINYDNNINISKENSLTSSNNNFDNFIKYTPESVAYNFSLSLRQTISASPTVELRPTFANRNRSVSSSSSFLRQQQHQPQQSSSYLFDDSFLNKTPSALGTPTGTPSFDSFEDILTPLETPTPVDEESNLEVCSINTSSTKRFKTVRRSNSIMSLKSSASINTTTQTNAYVPLSPHVSSNQRNNSSVCPVINTPTIGSRSRMLSTSSNVSLNQYYYQHVQKSPSSSNLNGSYISSAPTTASSVSASLSGYNSASNSALIPIKPKPITPNLQLSTNHLSRSRSSSGHTPNLRSATPNNRINLDTYLNYIDENKSKPQQQIQPQQPQQNQSQNQYQQQHQHHHHQYHHHQQHQHQHQPQYQHQHQHQHQHHQAQIQSSLEIPLQDKMQQIIIEQQKQILNQQLHHNDRQILDNIEILHPQNSEDFEEFQNVEKFDDLAHLEDIERSLQLQFTELGADSNIENNQSEMLSAELDQLINIIRLEDLVKEFDQ